MDKSESSHLILQHPEIDLLHGQMMELVKALARSDLDTYFALYRELIAHTEEHFAYEEALMLGRDYPHAAEHLAEHRQILGELKRFQHRKTSLSRAYIAQRLPERLALHINRLDSQLVAWLVHQS